jgi:formate hydrogenlyase transcriptional activator
MSVVSISALRSTPENELAQFEELAVTLSARLTRLRVADIAPGIASALNQIAQAMCVDSCRLFEFTDSGTLARVHVPGPERQAEAPNRLSSDGWLVERLVRGELVVISRPEEFPRDALATRRAGGYSVLGVPAWDSSRVVCALVIDKLRTPQRWTQPLVERLRLIAETLGTALRRCRREDAMRASHAEHVEIERLNSRLQADTASPRGEITTYHDGDDIVGECAPLRLAMTRLNQVAPMNSTVLLLGPTGSGKELFARALHQRSRRHARPLVRVNCAALPPTLVESELFGHEKGAFTGAVGSRQGRFELADGGTIFLDEIGDLSPEVQVKFLRVLQEGEFERVGSSRTRKVDVRVIAATHRDLDALVADGHFRADLYYRLSVYPLRLPSLHERTADIPRLVWFFINRHQRELGRRITQVPQAVIEALQRYTWPGNVRELENVVERALIASSGEILELDDPSSLRPQLITAAPASERLDDVQAAHIGAVLARCGWRINGSGNAAERLGVHPNTLRFRMKKLGVACPRERARLDAADSGEWRSGG